MIKRRAQMKAVTGPGSQWLAHSDAHANPVRGIMTAILLLLLLSAGCSTIHTARHTARGDAELEALLTKLKKQRDIKVLGPGRTAPAGINRLTVEKAGDDFLVSVDLNKASLREVIDRFLLLTHTPHALDTDLFYGDITAVFDRIPFLTAMNTLLAINDLALIRQNGILTPAAGENARTDAHVQAKTTGPSTTTVEITCRNTDVSKIIKVLEDFYSKDPSRAVRFAALHSSNAVVLSGPPDDVRRAARIVSKADRKPKHVLIEAMVVEVNSIAMEQLGIEITNAAHGEFSGISSALGSLTDKALKFTWAQVINPKTLTAEINYLVSKGNARIITRPYAATASGEKANITITNDRYVIVQAADAGASVSTAHPISSGAVLDIIPKVISETSILMDVKIEDSGFVPPPQNVSVEVDKNKASTVMQVNSGETIVIGGLILNRQSHNRSGLPVLGDLPLLNPFFGKRQNMADGQEVIIFITPHIWEPDTAPPVSAHPQSLITGE